MVKKHGDGITISNTDYRNSERFGPSRRRAQDKQGSDDKTNNINLPAAAIFVFKMFGRGNKRCSLLFGIFAALPT